MVRAVGMCGSDNAASKLHSLFKHRGVFLEKHNFRQHDDIIRRIAENKDIEAVLLVERAVRESGLDSMMVLEDLRNADPTLRILYVMDTPNYEFEMWCYDHAIFDIFYPVRDTDINVDAVCEALRFGRIDPDNPPPPPSPEIPLEWEEETETEPRERIPFKERLKSFSLPDLRKKREQDSNFELPDVYAPAHETVPLQPQSDNAEQGTVKPKPSKTNRSKRKPPVQADPYVEECDEAYSENYHPAETLPEYEPPNVPAYTEPFQERCIIGIINCSRGFGATGLSESLAIRLYEAGYDIAVLAMDGKPDLSFSKLPELGITLSIPGGDELPDWESLIEEHQLVIMDFGAIYEILPSGEPLPAQSRAETARIVRQAANACDFRVYLASEQPWHANKCKVFQKDPNGIILYHPTEDEILKMIGVF